MASAVSFEVDGSPPYKTEKRAPLTNSLRSVTSAKRADEPNPAVRDSVCVGDSGIDAGSSLRPPETPGMRCVYYTPRKSRAMTPHRSTDPVLAPDLCRGPSMPFALRCPLASSPPALALAACSSLPPAGPGRLANSPSASTWPARPVERGALPLPAAESGSIRTTPASRATWGSRTRPRASSRRRWIVLPEGAEAGPERQGDPHQLRPLRRVLPGVQGRTRTKAGLRRPTLGGRTRR